MGSIHADDKRLLGDLGGFIEPMEVYDAKGKLLGLFVPANLERWKEMYAKAEAMIDWDEIRRRREDSRPHIPHEEVLARLNLLEKEIQRRRTASEKPFTAVEAKAFVQALSFPAAAGAAIDRSAQGASS